MMDSSKNRHAETRNGYSSVTALIAGTVVGAGVAIAGAFALNNKNNRDKAKEILVHAKNQGADYMKDMQSQAQEKIEEAEGKLEGFKQKVKTSANSVKELFQDEARDVNNISRTK